MNYPGMPDAWCHAALRWTDLSAACSSRVPEPFGSRVALTDARSGVRPHAALTETGWLRPVDYSEEIRP